MQCSVTQNLYIFIPRILYSILKMFLFLISTLKIRFSYWFSTLRKSLKSSIFFNSSSLWQIFFTDISYFFSGATWCNEKVWKSLFLTLHLFLVCVLLNFGQECRDVFRTLSISTMERFAKLVDGFIKTSPLVYCYFVKISSVC